ncbi:MAG: hydroxymethylbilane synthase [Candidatus Omnitrophota bacterium]
MNKLINIGTRASKLALWQAEYISSLLAANNADFSFNIVRLKTTGDNHSRPGIGEVSIKNKNIFVKEIEEALINQEIDIAVHSLKDMSVLPKAGLLTAGFVGGASRCDALVFAKDLTFKDLPAGACIGTGSARRNSQLRILRDDLKVLPIRGNVDTRVKKLNNGEYDAIVLAQAGLERLGLKDAIIHSFSIEEMVPAAGQGIVAVQIREGDQTLKDVVKGISNVLCEYAAYIEFEFMKIIGAGCDLPLGVFAEIKEDIVNVSLFLSSLDFNHFIKIKKKYDITDIKRIAFDLAEAVKNSWREKTGKDLNFYEQ